MNVSLASWHIISSGASGQGGIMGNEAACVLSILAFPSHWLHTKPPSPFLLFFFVNHPSTQTIYKQSHTALNLSFTCLVMASVARAKSHWLLPSLVSQAGAPYGWKTLIDSGGPELRRGPVTWQGLDIYCFRLGVSCWHEAHDSWCACRS